MIEHRIGTSRRSGAVHVAAKVVDPPDAEVLPAARSGRPADAARRPRRPRAAAALRHRAPARRGPDAGAASSSTPIDGPTSNGAILYLHGGAFLLCGLNTHRRIVERLAQATGMAVLSVDYRQLPNGRLADSLADCEDALPLAGPQRPPGATGSCSPATPPAATSPSRPRSGSATRAAGGRPRSSASRRGSTSTTRAKWRHHNVRRDAYIPARRLRRVGQDGRRARTPQPHHSPVNADLARPAAVAHHVRRVGGPARRRRADDRAPRGGRRPVRPVRSGRARSTPSRCSASSRRRAARPSRSSSRS